MLHQNEIPYLIESLKESGFNFFEIETNSTIVPTKKITDYISWWNCSPKLSNNGISVSKNKNAEAIEAIAHGTEGESKVVGRKIEDINLPKGAAIVTLVRDHKVIMAHHDTVIETDDHVILFLTDRRKIENLEKLFQVGVSFV